MWYQPSAQSDFDAYFSAGSWGYPRVGAGESVITECFTQDGWLGGWNVVPEGATTAAAGTAFVLALAALM